MKRSEMITKIQMEGSYEAEEAESILSMLERSGMIPPRLSSDRCQAIMQIYYGGYTFNQWDEDFERDILAVTALERIQRSKENKNDAK